MCRYGLHSYRDHYVCFGCRKMFRKNLPDVDSWKLSFDQHVAAISAGRAARATCPQCAGSMAMFGLDFRPPPQDDIEAWRIVEHLYDRGFAFESCGCDGPGYAPPKRLKDLPAWLAEHSKKPASEGEKLLAAIAVRHG